MEGGGAYQKKGAYKRGWLILSNGDASEGGGRYSCKIEDSSEGGAYQRERIMRDIRWGLIRGA